MASTDPGSGLSGAQRSWPVTVRLHSNPAANAPVRQQRRAARGFELGMHSSRTSARGAAQVTGACAHYTADGAAHGFRRCRQRFSATIETRCDVESNAYVISRSWRTRRGDVRGVACGTPVSHTGWSPDVTFRRLAGPAPAGGGRLRAISGPRPRSCRALSSRTGSRASFSRAFGRSRPAVRPEVPAERYARPNRTGPSSRTIAASSTSATTPGCSSTDGASSAPDQDAEQDRGALARGRCPGPHLRGCRRRVRIPRAGCRRPAPVCVAARSGARRASRVRRRLAHAGIPRGRLFPVRAEPVPLVQRPHPRLEAPVAVLPRRPG